MRKEADKGCHQLSIAHRWKPPPQLHNPILWAVPQPEFPKWVATTYGQPSSPSFNRFFTTVQQPTQSPTHQLNRCYDPHFVWTLRKSALTCCTLACTCHKHHRRSYNETHSSVPQVCLSSSIPVHGVGKVDRGISCNILDQLHAAIKVGVNAQHQGPIGDGLNQLC